MGPLFKLVEQYRNESDELKRCEIAEKIILAVGPRLRAFVFNQLPPDPAKDVAQEVLVGIAKGLHMFYGETERALWNWCFHVARNKLCDRLRIQYSLAVTPIDPAELSEIIESVTTQGETLTIGDRMDAKYIMELLAATDPPCYDLLWKHFIYGWDYNDLARENGLSYDATRMKIKRCVELAQDIMKGKH